MLADHFRWVQFSLDAQYFEPCAKLNLPNGYLCDWFLLGALNFGPGTKQN